jgi:hypothetical protein
MDHPFPSPGATSSLDCHTNVGRGRVHETARPGWRAFGEGGFWRPLPNPVLVKPKAQPKAEPETRVKA